jgi:deoxycytidylate deaminase
MKNINVLFETAQKTAEKSPCKFKVSCVLVDSRGNVVATGYNHHGNRRNKLGQWSIHAEADALNKVRKPSTNLTAFVYRRGAKIITPCATCTELLKSYGIRTIWHTTGHLELGKINQSRK